VVAKMQPTYARPLPPPARVEAWMQNQNAVDWTFVADLLDPAGPRWALPVWTGSEMWARVLFDVTINGQPFFAFDFLAYSPLSGWRNMGRLDFDNLGIDQWDDPVWIGDRIWIRETTTGSNGVAYWDGVFSDIVIGSGPAGGTAWRFPVWTGSEMVVDAGSVDTPAHTLYAFDGIAWSPVTAVPGGKFIHALAFLNGKLYASLSDNNAIPFQLWRYGYDDGSGWVQITSDPIISQLGGPIATGDRLFFSVLANDDWYVWTGAGQFRRLVINTPGKIIIEQFAVGNNVLWAQNDSDGGSIWSLTDTAP